MSLKRFSDTFVGRLEAKERIIEYPWIEAVQVLARIIASYELPYDVNSMKFKPECNIYGSKILLCFSLYADGEIMEN